MPPPASTACPDHGTLATPSNPRDDEDERHENTTLHWTSGCSEYSARLSRMASNTFWHDGESHAGSTASGSTCTRIAVSSNANPAPLSAKARLSPSNTVRTADSEIAHDPSGLRRTWAMTRSVRATTGVASRTAGSSQSP